MTGRVDRLLAEHLDQALDLPPATVMDDIPKLPAADRARRRFVGGETAKLLDELGCLVGSGGVGNVNVGRQEANYL